MTREEAIRAIQIHIAYSPMYSMPKTREALDMAISALREQPQWISVEERLPKKITNKVLVYCKNGYIGFGHYENFRGVEDWYNLESGKPFREWDLEDCETYEVTHWMPLPEPPKEEV